MKGVCFTNQVTSHIIYVTLSKKSPLQIYINSDRRMNTWNILKMNIGNV
jgi:hypothetical protein